MRSIYTYTTSEGREKEKGRGRDHNIPARGETNYVRKRRGERTKEKSIYRDPETSFQWYIANGTFLKGGENAFSGRLFVRRGTCLLTNEVLSTKVLLFPSSSFLRPPNGTQQEKDSFISVPSSLFLCCRRRFEWAFSLRRLNIYPSKRMGVGTSLWLSHLS